MRRTESRLSYLIVAGVVSASRVPFLTAGYGNDPDAWAVARAARAISAQHQYVASRLPGNPVHEGVCSLFHSVGPAALNGLSAFMSVVAALALLGMLRRLSCRDSVWIAIGFAMTPVVFVASVTSIDYVWAIAFAWLGFWAAVARRPIVAGVCLGLAIGCRITSILMLPAVVWWIWRSVDSSRRAQFATLCIGAAMIVGALAFAPVYNRYGLEFFSFVEPPQPTAVTAIISRGLLRVWGPLGLLAAVAAVFARCLKRPPAERCAIPALERQTVLLPAIFTIVVYVLAFLRLPLEEGYLVPIVPFVLVVAATLLDRRWIRRACVALILAPWICALGRPAPGPWAAHSNSAIGFRIGGSDWVLDVFRGPLLRDYSDRIAGMRYVDRVMEQIRLLPDEAVVVVGFWKPQFDVRFADEPKLLQRILYLVDAEQSARLQNDGRPVYFLEEMRDFNLSAGRVDLAAIGRPLFGPPPQS